MTEATITTSHATRRNALSALRQAGGWVDVSELARCLGIKQYALYGVLWHLRTNGYIERDWLGRYRLTDAGQLEALK